MKVWHCIFNDMDKTNIKEEEDAIDRAGNRREFMICSILAMATTFRISRERSNLILADLSLSFSLVLTARCNGHPISDRLSLPYLNPRAAQRFQKHRRDVSCQNCDKFVNDGLSATKGRRCVRALRIPHRVVSRLASCVYKQCFPLLHLRLRYHFPSLRLLPFPPCCLLAAPPLNSSPCFSFLSAHPRLSGERKKNHESHRVVSPHSPTIVATVEI